VNISIRYKEFEGFFLSEGFRMDKLSATGLSTFVLVQTFGPFIIYLVVKFNEQRQEDFKLLMDKKRSEEGGGWLIH
jgi:hypothetical protein